MTTVSPYGSWPSPITADLLVEKAVSLSYPMNHGSDILWLEMRPAEAGRYVIVRRSPDGTVTDVLPEGFAARTLAHEYGGLAYTVFGETIFFSNFSDQRMYRIDPGSDPQPITAEPPEPRAYRFADQVVSPDGRWVMCIRERHTPEGVLNEIAAISADATDDPQDLFGGHDFYSAPRLSPAGDRLAWLSWDHPRMPWDGTELWEAPIGPDLTLGKPRKVAGGTEESVSQPRYSPDGQLYFISDASGWWNIYVDEPAGARAVAPMDAEFAGPDWVFGQSSYTFLNDGSLVAIWAEEGLDRIGVMRPGDDRFTPIETGYTVLHSIRPFGSGVLAIAASAAEAPAVVVISIPDGGVQVIRRSRELTVSPDLISAPRAIEFPTEGGLTAHALFYAPDNPDYAAPEGELPPLIVISHGGPTAATSSALNLGIQFWTSRGIGVVDVNYGGSTGYGREYRRRLNGTWGIVDVDDCINAARYLADRGEADGNRLVIRGGSAGGYTTLCALTFRDAFACGGSHYGVADAGALAEDTHKFESRYLDGLIGPWPEARALYEERSPIFHTDRLSTPLILFQGLEDEIVPPAQAERMAEALRSKGVPFAYLAYEGEQHGFRKAENIKRTAEAELYFYGRILGFTPADDLPPVEIENAEAITAPAR
ncbi:MAG TPA: S9 family peptidase [Actinomycetota bacterium]|nr:S9 family peptidase [Actinomycetota bacterium]